jgi:hypothetical protein
MSRKSPQYSVTSGEILVGLAWVVAYILLIASGLAQDAMLLLAGRTPSELF